MKKMKYFLKTKETAYSFLRNREYPTIVSNDKYKTKMSSGDSKIASHVLSKERALRDQIVALEEEVNALKREERCIMIDKEMERNEKKIVELQNENTRLSEEKIKLQTVHCLVEKTPPAIKKDSVVVAEGKVVEAVVAEGKVVEAVAVEIVEQSVVGGGCRVVEAVVAEGNVVVAEGHVVKENVKLSSAEKWNNVPVGTILLSKKDDVVYNHYKKTADGKVIRLNAEGFEIGDPISIKEAADEYKTRANISYRVYWYHNFYLYKNNATKSLALWRGEKEFLSVFLDKH